MPPQSFKEALSKKLTKNQLALVPRAFDVVGTIAIFSHLPDELKKKESIIAKTLLEVHSHIKTVAKKVSDHQGTFRTKKVRVLAGQRTKTTTHTESGARIMLNIETCYFSPRLSQERMRIAKQVKDGERVLVLFSGVSVYPLVIAKNSKPLSITAVELNPDAHKFALENIKKNKFEEIITAIKADVQNVKLKGKFDRIIMPLPKGAKDYLDVALKYSKKGTIIHLYVFTDKTIFPDGVIDLVKDKLKNIKILDTVQCGTASPSKIRVCVDIRVKKS